MLNERLNNPVLNSIILGKNNKKHVLILHGLYGNLDNWRNVGSFLSKQYCVHLLDSRNHGKSFHSSSHTYNDLVNDIENYTSFYNISNLSIIGHSMGGKAAMFFAEKHPQKIDNLIILDISPRNYRYLTENEPNIIYHLNIISIIKNLNLDLYSTYSEINSQIETNDKNIKNLILKNLKKTKGKFSWKMNVEAISNNLNNIFDGLNPDNYINKKIPVKSLFIKASNSEYIDNNDKKLINFIFSNASIIDIENVGHWLHIEQPGKLQSLILDFLKMD